MITTITHGQTERGFLVNHIEHTGSVLCLPSFTLLWDVKGWADVTPDSLRLFAVLQPKIELLLIGCGSRVERLSPQLSQFLDAHGIIYELQTTSSALGLFNVLLEENRRVAAALVLPPEEAPQPSFRDQLKRDPFARRNHKPNK